MRVSWAGALVVAREGLLLLLFFDDVGVAVGLLGSLRGS